MSKKIVIFDLDGTLLNTLQDLTDSTNFALSQFGYPIHSIHNIQGFIGNGVAKLIERAIPQGKHNSNYLECLNIFKKHYSQNMYNKTEPYRGIIVLLENLKNRNIKIAVVSNKFDDAVKSLCKKYFPNLINYAFGENEAKGVQKKPAPDTILEVLNISNSTPEEAIYIGDSEVDIQTAQNANMECISVTWGFKSKDFLIQHGAKVIVDEPQKILEYL